MIQEAISYLFERGKDSAAPHREVIGGIEYSDKPLTPIKPPLATPLGIHRLRGFADFVLAKNETLDQEHTLVHVVSPWEVQYISALDKTHRTREVYVKGIHSADRSFKFQTWYSPEEFNIALVTLFGEHTDAKPNDRPRLIELVGNAAAGFENAVEDDGITQKITIKAGTSLKARGTIQNPFNLVPHRTFPEVEQPKSPFILRAKLFEKDAPPHFALFEADGGAWQIDAIENIHAWLEEKLKGTNIPILA